MKEPEKYINEHLCGKDKKFVTKEDALQAIRIARFELLQKLANFTKEQLKEC